ncbi:hypothetical protein BT96DRAFT_1002934 [Gymnopus androsaceus JB14]|uniref:Uncharacterized protein n=1 Tax=Gymnopus androsaceus JB14 TaxID=1447944 RepID=A0A6A4GXG6_9AGAR|nr:hypothetical protein BT96DRAFT_1002934 [Gymnopus androsaceus JB14]
MLVIRFKIGAFIRCIGLSNAERVLLPSSLLIPLRQCRRHKGVVVHRFVAAATILRLFLQPRILITVNIFLILNMDVLGHLIMAIRLLKLPCDAVAGERFPRGDMLLSATLFAIPGTS